MRDAEHDLETTAREFRAAAASVQLGEAGLQHVATLPGPALLVRA